MSISATQTETVYRFSVDALPQFTGSGSSANVAWTSSRGTFSASTTANGVATTFTPDNFSGLITITARDTGNSQTVTLTLEVIMVFPYQPDWKGNAASVKDDKTLVSLAEDGSPSFLVKGDSQRVFKYGFNERTRDEFTAVDALWEWHRKTLVFLIKDQPRGLPNITPELVPVRFDSELDDDPQGTNNISYSFVLREAVDA